MVEINIVYQGTLRCTATHKPSGTILVTDAPVDNQGKGESFSPTDLIATALGTCMLTTMGIVAQRLSIALEGVQLTVRKEMAGTPSRHIERLTVSITVPGVLEDPQKESLTRAAMGCPVKQSLHPDIQMPVEFIWA